MTRCAWVSDSELYIRYHDEEWGVPVYEDNRLFEMLCLEGAQAGLSWETVLNKREGYRRIFRGFEIDAVLEMGLSDVESAVLDPAIIRHRGKVESVLINARAAKAVQAEFGSLRQFLWSFVGDSIRVGNWSSIHQLPSTTTESDAMSKALKKRGFKFVGSTICYAFMQACGMVDDHTVDCFRFQSKGFGQTHES
jgi:DNA-3-methyladenine glycosylase I